MPYFLALNTEKPLAFWFLTEGIVAFFASHWEEYHTGKLVMGLIANPTEVQCALMVIFVIAGLKGVSRFIF